MSDAAHKNLEACCHAKITYILNMRGTFLSNLPVEVASVNKPHSGKTNSQSAELIIPYHTLMLNQT